MRRIKKEDFAVTIWLGCCECGDEYKFETSADLLEAAMEEAAVEANQEGWRGSEDEDYGYGMECKECLEKAKETAKVGTDEN